MTPLRHRGAPASATLVALAAALAAAGCTTLFPSSSPVRYYTLAGGAGEPTSVTQCAVRFGVRSVSLPGYIDRDEIPIARQGTQLVISSSDLWAASLRVEMSRTLGEAVGARWSGSRFVPHPWRFGETPPWALEVAFEQLDPSGQELVVRARWSLQSTADLREPGANGAADSPAASASPAAPTSAATASGGAASRARLPREIASGRLDTRVPRTSATAGGTADAIVRAATALADQIATQGASALAANDPACR